MAMSYFYNFVLPTAAVLVTKTPGVDMEKSRGVFEDYVLQTPTFYIFIPRTLDGSDLKKALSDGTRSGALRMGKPKPPPDSDRQHRPMFMYFLTSDSEVGSDASNSMWCSYLLVRIVHRNTHAMGCATFQQ